MTTEELSPSLSGAGNGGTGSTSFGSRVSRTRKIPSDLALPVVLLGTWSEKWGLAEWRSYDRARAVRTRAVVEGAYVLASKGEEGTIAGEVRRMLSRNPSVDQDAARRLIGELKGKVGALPAIAPVVAQQQVLEAST